MKVLILIFSFSFLNLHLFALHNWNIVSLPTTENLNEIQFVNDSVGFIAGEKGILMKTINKGENWNIINTPDTFNILSLAFTSETEGGILIENQFNQPMFYITKNSGTSWEQKPSTFNGFCFPNVLYAVEDKILIGGNGCFYGDGIAVFQNDTIIIDTMLNLFGTIRQFNFVDDNIGFAASNYNSIYKTLDGGLTWNIIDLPNSISQVYDIAFQDEMIGYLVGLDTSESAFNPKVVFKTKDGGITWEDDLGALFVTPKFTEVEIFAPDSVIIAGHYEDVFNDNGTVWFNYYGQSVTGYTEWWATDTNTIKVKKNDIEIQNECIYIIGDEGFLSSNCLKADTTSNPPDTTSTGLIKLEELDFNLYPNPATRYINLDLKHLQGGNYSFQIIDLIGKVVFSENEKIEINYSKKINLENLSNGIHFLTITNNQFTVSKYFEVIK